MGGKKKMGLERRFAFGTLFFFSTIAFFFEFYLKAELLGISSFYEDSYKVRNIWVSWFGRVDRLSLEV